MKFLGRSQVLLFVPMLASQFIPEHLNGDFLARYRCNGIGYLGAFERLRLSARNSEPGACDEQESQKIAHAGCCNVPRSYGVTLQERSSCKPIHNGSKLFSDHKGFWVQAVLPMYAGIRDKTVSREQRQAGREKTKAIEIMPQKVPHGRFKVQFSSAFAL